jgi:hypothetical protein
MVVQQRRRASLGRPSGRGVAGIGQQNHVIALGIPEGAKRLGVIQ